MSQITYQNAIDEKGNLINISNVHPENHRGSIFKCLSCGREMIAKIGNPSKQRTKASHFAHKQVCDCSLENYLHKLGKLKFKQRFESDTPIMVKVPVIQQCKKLKDCPIGDASICITETEECISLKDYYDSCSEEKEYKGYRADLLLESSLKDIPPLFIEIAYSHRCTPEKMDSGLKIIEIDVTDEQQLEYVINNVLNEEEGFVRFYNFEKKLSKNAFGEERGIWLVHFKLFSSCKAFANRIWCHKADFAKIGTTSEVEYMIYPSKGQRLSEETLYDIGFSLATNDGIEFKNCSFCKYHKINSNLLYLPEETIVCNLHSKYNTPQYPQQTDAKKCRYYRVDKEKIENVQKEIAELKYVRLPLKDKTGHMQRQLRN